MENEIKISVVIPIYNESENLPDLFEKLNAVLPENDASWEVLLVDDGSRDNSAELISQQAAEDSRYIAIRFLRNYGQTAAMQAGFDAARGDVIVPMDADLQNDPADIPRLLEKLDEGYDVVSGWRKNRKDKAIKRVFLSRVANKIISQISGVTLHDYGCSLKAYRRVAINDVRLYGEMHRFIPIYASWNGGKVTEIVVEHYPRTKGTSNYGMERIFKVVLDLIVVKFLYHYSQKPMYIFGGFGLINLMISGIVGIIALYLKFADIRTLSSTPLPILCIGLASVGIFSIMNGLLAELMTRTYYESQNKKTYKLKDDSQ